MHVSGKVLALLRDLALPPRCAGCGEIVGAAHRFCAPCWSSLRFIGPPWCAGCNVPFEHDRGEGMRCARCLADAPMHDGVRAAVAYGPVARTVALRLKYARRTAYAETAARLMVRHLPPATTVLVPVPLHRSRLWQRGYNQAALIADHLSRLSGVPSDRTSLVRHRATAPLRGHSRRARAEAVRAAFRISGDALAGHHVALVDDVYTSGATTDACTGVLLRAGVASVTILAWARVLDNERERDAFEAVD
ncbi:ComF family protein [uncultured Sphingomonas sp.]|uniref:ComF family protein n=1 Tax=uncultured Sphingomonas sp. TaxID=158754 RepID=UPI0026176233|nr:ComF family protein [uncultured Sphingomonas sp.]